MTASPLRQRCSLSLLLFNIGLEILAIVIRELKKKKESKLERKKLKCHFLQDDMTLYIENPKDVIRKLLELISEFGIVIGYKINTQKSVAFLYTNNGRSERAINETIPITITSQRTKYLGINQHKETKDMYSENNTLIKETEDATNRWKDI